MKNTIVIILVLISLNCFAQTNGTNGKVEQPKIVMPADSIDIFSLKDIDNYLVALRKISVESYEKMTPKDVVNDIYNWMILEWNRKKKK